MAMQSPGTILCVTAYEKGHEFIQACKEDGWRVILLTTTTLEHGNWPWENIDEFFHMPDLADDAAVLNGVSYLARSQRIDRISPLNDFEVELAGLLREHLQIPGIGTSTARLFRDKLAMRVRARDAGMRVPEFVGIIHYADIANYMERVPGPWVMKPRSEATAIGITKVEHPQEVWDRMETLGDRQSYFLLEQYIPGDVYHVDSIISEGDVVFSEVQKYGHPPMDVFHSGGIPTSRTLPRDSEEVHTLRSLHRQMIAAFGLPRGVTHTEFIKGPDGEFYFLETGARVGGANTVELVEAATGVNLWKEWAKLEMGQGQIPYELPPRREGYAGIILTLARQERPDTSDYTDPEIVWRMNKPNHAGLLVASDNPDRVKSLLEQYSPRFADDFHARLPGWEERPASM